MSSKRPGRRRKKGISHRFHWEDGALSIESSFDLELYTIDEYIADLRAAMIQYMIDHPRDLMRFGGPEEQDRLLKQIYARLAPDFNTQHASTN